MHDIKSIKSCDFYLMDKINNYFYQYQRTDKLTRYRSLIVGRDDSND